MDHEVSILVLVDVPLEGSCSYLLASTVLFQSLFSWMFRSKSMIRFGLETFLQVSILVLVDVPLEASSRRTTITGW